MDTSKATARPWYSHNIGLGPHGNGPYTFPIGTEPDEAAANAALIVRAVNSHEALVAALREITELTDDHGVGDYSQGMYDGLEMASRIARAALALAEQGGG